MEGPESEPPLSRPRRTWGQLLGAWGCWIWGTHVAGLIPGVVGYLMLFHMEIGEILPTPPGRFLLAIFLISSVSTVAWMTAGWQFFQRRNRRGVVHFAVAVVAELLSVGMLVAVWAIPDRVFR